MSKPLPNISPREVPLHRVFVGQRIRETMHLLSNFPTIGHEGALQGTREMVVPGLPYIMVHRVEPAEGAVVILGIYHGARRRPGQEKP
jgi:toxin ParE1/3/4